MNMLQKTTARVWLKTCLAAFTVLSVPALSADPFPASSGTWGGGKTKMTINAGTVFNLTPQLTFPWHHQVRGIVQVSRLGNCKVFFQVELNEGSACRGGHDFCLSGTMTITTLAGDKLLADVAGWAESDPNDSKPTPSMYKLHYDVTVTGGTGELAGARGQGEIDGAFLFSGPDDAGDTDPTDDRFCDGYAGVATWLFEGAVLLPRCGR